MDITNFVEDLNKKYNSIVCETNLKKIREARLLSQNELAELSGVNKRSIQLYEQRVNDIDKAQVHSLFKMSRVLGCTIEDLLENPQA
jgi:transcriptional regulator with XRE-family HTH domain